MDICLFSQISTKENRNVKHTVLSSMEEMYTSFPPGKLVTDVINNLVACAICRARPHLNPPDYYVSSRHFLPRLLSRALFLNQTNPSLKEISFVLYNSLGDLCAICRVRLFLNPTYFYNCFTNSP